MAMATTMATTMARRAQRNKSAVARCVGDHFDLYLCLNFFRRQLSHAYTCPHSPCGSSQLCVASQARVHTLKHRDHKVNYAFPSASGEHFPDIHFGAKARSPNVFIGYARWPHHVFASPARFLSGLAPESIPAACLPGGPLTELPEISTRSRACVPFVYPEINCTANASCFGF